MALTFLNETPIYNPDRDTLRVIGIDASRHIVCRITKPALLAMEHLDDASPTRLLEIFANHRQKIEQAAQRIFQQDALQSDGSILISAEPMEHRLTA